jgi:hypothetical protein
MADDILDFEVENSERSLAVIFRKSQNTKRQHKLKVENFKKWLCSRHPVRSKEDETIDLNAFDRTILKEFFGHSCKKKDKDGLYFDLIVFHARSSM